MESPERNLQVLDCEHQGSPTFSFLCTLSPIKPVRSACLAQTYSEIHFQSSSSYNHHKVGQEDTEYLKRYVRRDYCKNTASTTKVNRLTQTTPLEHVNDSTRDNETMGQEEKYPTTPVNMSSISKKDNHDCIVLDMSEHSMEAHAVSMDTISLTACNRSDKGSDSMEQDIVLENSNMLSNTPYLSSSQCGDCKKLMNINREMSELELMMFGETHCDKRSQQERSSNENESQVSSPTLLGLSMEEVEEYIASLKEVVKDEHQKVETGSISNGDGECKLDGDDLIGAEANVNRSPSAACRVTGVSQRGVRRRCLDFNVKIESDTISLATKSQDPMASYDEKSDPSAFVSREQGTHSMKHSETHVVSNTAAMPCGIGLHLNSLTRSLSFPQALRSNDNGCGSSPLMKKENVIEKLGISECHRDNASPKGSETGVQGASSTDFVSKTEVDSHNIESDCCTGVRGSSRSVTCSMNGVKQLQFDRPTGLGKRPCPLGRKRVSLPGLLKDLEVPEDQTDQTPPSPLKKRRKTSFTSENSGDGCKRCTCKKSKCLKLYCECFAAGVYCGDSCTCQGCFNRPEYEKTVMEAREQIESRNPLAFAPKIVLTTEVSPIVNKEPGRGTPGHVGRHKRGCNCKRSHCLKKYCECYQAGVACTDACRCECCENSFGRKSGIDEKEIRLEVFQEKTVDDTDTSDICDQSNDISRQQTNSLSPLTPSFDHIRKNRLLVHSSSASKTSVAFSEDIHSSMGSLPSTMKCMSPNRLLRSCNKAGHRSGAFVNSTMTTPQRKSHVITPRILRIGNRWDDISTVTPLPKAPSEPTTCTFMSVLDGKESSSSRTPTETCEQNVPTTPVFSSPASHVDATPCFSSGEGVDTQLLDWLEEDDDDSCTPEFLRNVGVSMPVCLLNSNSPKHKRVSPPHVHGVTNPAHAMINHRRRSSNSCIRSGRKFILQSVPTLLPVTSALGDQTPVINIGCRDGEAL